MSLDANYKNSLIKQNLKRIIQLEPVINQHISRLDLCCSNVYDREDAIETIANLSNALGQMDSDLLALSSLLDD